MKLSKTSWISLIIGVIVIAAVSLGWAYSQQLDQQKQLDSSLKLAKQKLAQIKFDDLNSQRDQLTVQIEKVNAQIDEIKDKLSSSSDSINVTDVILSEAKNHNVDILEMSSSGTSNGDLSGAACQTLSVVLKVEGSLRDIAEMAVALNQKFPTSIDTLIQMSRLPPPTPTPTPAPEGTSTPAPTSTPVYTESVPVVSPEKGFSANISVVIYSYKGE